MSIRPTRRLAWLGALGLAIAYSGSWVLSETGPEKAAPSSRQAARVDASASTRARAPVPRSAQPVAFDPNRVPGASHAAALAMFREYSKFPPNSRPADASRSDIAEPMMIAVAPQPLLRTDAAGKKVSAGVFCWMQPALHHVARGQEQRLTLRCVRGSERDAPGTTGLPLGIESVSAEVDAGNGAAALELGGAKFRDDGADGDETAADGIYTMAMRTSDERLGLVKVSAGVRLALREADDPLEPQTLNASFLLEAPPAARFTDHVADRLERGSLIVTVELDVERAGRYRVFANLEHEGELLAYAKDDRDLQVGVQRIDLLFFGKILHDAGVEGAFDVTALRGQRFNLDPANGGPLAERLATIPHAHRTAVYRASDFSPDEWTSPYKEERLAELSALAASE
jgi:hypothetical protein